MGPNLLQNGTGSSESANSGMPQGGTIGPLVSKFGGPNANARGVPQGGAMGPLPSETGPSRSLPDSSPRRIPQGCTLGPIVSESAWHQASDTDSKFRVAMDGHIL